MSERLAAGAATSDPASVVTTARVAEGVYQITIDRPERRNALNMDVKSRVADAVEALTIDDDVRAIVIAGAGGVFVAGTDIAEMRSMTPTSHSLQVTDRMFTTLRKCPKPLIAAVESYAFGGGCELAMCCDLIVAGDSAKFGQPEIRLGIMPGAGACQRMVRVMGKFQAMRLILTGESITAPEAFGMGLVSEVTEAGSAVQRAIELASTIAAMPQLSVLAIKEVMSAGADVPLDAALLLERKAFQILFDSHDQEEGMDAFLEKRKPDFQGR
jgi:enoyl-CoA hydratase